MDNPQLSILTVREVITVKKLSGIAPVSPRLPRSTADTVPYSTTTFDQGDVLLHASPDQSLRTPVGSTADLRSRRASVSPGQAAWCGKIKGGHECMWG